MEHPVHEVTGVIGALCQGTKDEQAKALEDYYTPDAFFIHPFCRVPSFGGFELPIPGAKRTRIDSRLFVKLVYQWYRILSPKIEFNVDSVVFDQRTQMLYMTIRQVFSIHFVPFHLWTAHVKLVTVLSLTLLPVDPESKQPLLGPASSIAPGDSDIPKRYFIRGQEDYYQVNEFLKFIFPVPFLWTLWQLFATLLCSVGVALYWPFTVLFYALAERSTKVAKRA